MTTKKEGCSSCAAGYNGRNGNGYPPCSCHSHNDTRKPPRKDPILREYFSPLLGIVNFLKRLGG